MMELNGIPVKVKESPEFKNTRESLNIPFEDILNLLKSNKEELEQVLWNEEFFLMGEINISGERKGNILYLEKLFLESNIL